MALSSCKECGAQVSTEAKACPHCGVKAPANRPGASPSVLAKRYTLSPRLKILLGVMFIGLIANVMISARRPAQPREANRQADAKPVDACYDQGYNGATVYLANIKTAIEVGSRASEMMDFICRDAVQKIGGHDCLGQCEAGFRHKAKSWVNGKP